MNKATKHELLDLEMPSVPPRSRLFHLEPIGLGTPYVESLTSYIVRLAEAHCVYPKELMLQEILPNVADFYHSKFPYGILNIYRYSPQGSWGFNGSSELTNLLVQALQSLTLYTDLRFLTMLPWSAVLPQGGILRKTRAWCPKCYEEWRNKRVIIYEPLLWSLQVVKVCPLHEQILYSECPYEDCKAVLPILPPQAKSGVCSRCNRWLDATTDVNTSSKDTVEAKDIEFKKWSAQVIGELLAFTPQLSKEPEKKIIASKIALYMDHVAKGSRKFFAQRLQVPANWIARWEKGQKLLSLDTLTEVCYRLGTSPLSFLTEELTSSMYTQSPLTDEHSFRRVPNGKHKRFDRDQLQCELEAALSSDEVPPPSLNEIAQRLGYSSTYNIKRCFPELSKAVARRHLENTDINEIRSTLEKILADNGPFPPPLSEVARRLGYQNTQFIREHFPELSTAIAARYRNNFDSGELRCTLEKELASGEIPPPSLSKVARRLGHSNTHALYKYCPELSRAIAARYCQYFGAERVESALAAILESNEFPPPTLQMVAKRLGYSHANILQKQFPEQCQAIVAQWRTATAADIAHVEKILQETLMSDEVPFPSQLTIAQRIGQNVNFIRLHFPELSQAIVTKRRESFGFNKVQALLEAQLESKELPYLSLNEVSSHFGYNITTLQQRFPELTSKISERYRTYRKQINQEKMQRISQEVQLAVHSLHDQGLYPSTTRVMCFLSNPNDMRERCAREVRHQLLQELGWE